MRVIFIISFALLALLTPQSSPADPTVNRLLDFGTEVLRQTNQPDYSRPPPQQQPRYRDRSWQDDQHYTRPRQPSYAEPYTPPPAYNREQVAEIQRLLTDLGYEPGPIDGLFGEKTARGIRAFERANGLPVTGVPSDELIPELRHALASAPSTGHAALSPAPESEDCLHAGSAAERTICASPELTSLDDELDSAFADALERSDDRDRIRAGQDDWLARRDHCGADQECLARAMRNRISELRSVSAVTSRGGRDLAYIALRNAAQVAVVDLGSGSIIERIKVGPLPRGTTASADGSTVAVVNDGDITVSLIDTDTNEVVETLVYQALRDRIFQKSGAADGAHDDDDNSKNIGNVVLGPSGNRVYIADSWFGVISVDRVSGETAMLGDIHGGRQEIGPTGGIIKISQDGSRIFLPDSAHQGLTIIDTDTMTMAGTVPRLYHGAFDVSDDGKFVVEFYQEIQIGDLETFEVRQITDDQWRQSRMATLVNNTLDPVEISPDGSRLYALREVDKPAAGPSSSIFQIRAYDLRTGSMLSEVTVGEQPTDGMALTRDGRHVVIASPATNTLHVYNARDLSEVKVVKVAPTPRAYIDFIISKGAPEKTTPVQQVAEADAAASATDSAANDSAAGLLKAEDDQTPRNDSPAMVARAQDRLNALGYDAGPVDGNFGRQTRRAILEFEFDHELEATGSVSHALLARLDAAAADSQAGTASQTQAVPASTGQASNSHVLAAAAPDDLRAKAMAFIQSSASSARTPLEPSDEVTIELVELNGQPPREAFAIVKGFNWCGSRGCSAQVLDLSGPQAVSIGDFIASRLEVLPGTTGGWQDIAVNGHRQIYHDGKYRRP